VTPAGWAALAEWFALGEPRAAPGCATRDVTGEIWRLDTDRGCWAVKPNAIGT
jgi:hypothetical protein